MLGFLNENHKADCRLLDSPRTSIAGVAAAGGYGDPLRRKPGKSLAVGRWFNFNFTPPPPHQVTACRKRRLGRSCGVIAFYSLQLVKAPDQNAFNRTAP